MSALLLIIALVIGYLVIKGRKVTVEPPAGEEPFDIFSGITPSAQAGDGYYTGQTLYHKETGEKVEILRLPEIWNGEATIQWVDGGTGEIHRSSLREFFE